jgi:hypothetical protein
MKEEDAKIQDDSLKQAEEVESTNNQVATNTSAPTDPSKEANPVKEEVKIEVLEEEWDNTNSPIKPKKSFAKLLAKLLIGLSCILVFVLIILLVFHNVIVSSMVTKAGTLLVGTPVSLGKFNISLSGKVEIADFKVGNPEGYQNQYAFQLKRIFVDVNLPSVLSDEIVVNKVEIDGVAVDFESKLTTNNLNDIKANVEKNINSLTNKFTGKKSKETTEEEPAAEEPVAKDEKKAAKSVLIKYLSIKNTALTMSNKTLSSTVKLPVADLEMTDVGGKGQSIAEVVNKVLNSFFSSTQNTISNGAKVISDAGIKLGNSLLNTGKNIGDSVVDTGKKVGNSISETGKKIFKNLGF